MHDDDDGKVVELRHSKNEKTSLDLVQGGEGKTRGLKRGHKRGPTKVTTTIKEATLLAAKNIGSKFHRQGLAENSELVGYLEFVAETDPRAFMGLLTKILPVQIQAEVTLNDGLAERLQRARERIIEGERVA